jgi:glutamyl-tRNA synthetase
MKPQQVRVRFAPSPTGLLHAGNVRTALYNWLFARRHGGDFILRIEDTDVARSSEEATEVILETFRWLDLDWDEGPFFQSQRRELYREQAEKLLKRGLAYYSEDEVKRRAVRFKVSKGITRMHDLIYGPIEFDSSLIEDFVIVKSDGFPTYNFACVVDDADLKITHVIRGEGHISNTPKQIILYEALGYQLPEFAHIPHILAAEGGGLSKRLGAKPVIEFREEGYLPDAVVNFLALLGWSPGDDRELFTRQEMVESFSLERVKKSGSRFDPDKLVHINAWHIRQAPAEQLVSVLKRSLQNAELDPTGYDHHWLRQVVEIYRERIRTMGEFVQTEQFLFSDDFEYQEEALRKVASKEGVPELLEAAAAALEGLGQFTPSELESALRKLAKDKGIGFGKLAQPVRVAVTGATASAGLFDVLTLIGRERAIRRLRNASRLLRPHSDGTKG